MKLGIYGNGMIAQHFIKFVRDTDFKAISIQAVMARNEKKLKEICKEYQIPHWYTEPDDMLTDEIDTVYVAVPNHLHFEYVKKSLEAGKHVICEKPFTSNAKEANELSNLARKKKLVLIEAVTTHYFPNMLKIKEKLPELGNIKMVVLNYSSYSSRYDDFRKGNILPVFDWKMSGGALMDANIYNIHFLVDLFGKPRNSYYYANIENGIDTSGVAVFDYGGFKCVAIGTKDCKAPVSVTIEGTDGYISIPYTVNTLAGYKFSKTRTKGLADDDIKEENYNQSKYHMYHEFTEFERIIREGDFEKAYQLLDLSLTVTEIQTELRKQANIVFEADKSEIH